MHRLKFCVIGAGHGGLAMAGHLAMMGFPTNIFNRSESRIHPIQERGGIEIEGEIKGFGKIKLATSDIKKGISKANLIMVVVPAIAHRYVAEICAPHLKDGQIVILNPGRTFGALEFQQVLKEKKCKADVIVAEAQTFIYASRAMGPGQAKIFRIKNSIPVSAIKAYRTPEVLHQLKAAFPQFVRGDCGAPLPWRWP